MKRMEFTLKVTTDGPISHTDLMDALKPVAGVTAVDVTNYRVLPAKKAAKPEAVKS